MVAHSELDALTAMPPAAVAQHIWRRGLTTVGTDGRCFGSGGGPAALYMKGTRRPAAALTVNGRSTT